MREWINCFHELPKDGQSVLAVNIDIGEIELYIYWEDGRFPFTHWMPLPEPPKV